MTVMAMAVMVALVGVCVHAGIVSPSRPSLLVLCNEFCQHYELYAAPPSDVREREWYDIGRGVGSLVDAAGGSMYYLGYFNEMSSDETSAALIAATLQNHEIGTVVCFSDLTILPRLPQILYNVLFSASSSSGGSILTRNNFSEMVTYWRSAARRGHSKVSESSKYAVVVLDDLLSGDGVHDVRHHIDVVSAYSASAAALDHVSSDPLIKAAARVS
eukprot:CAMPEP_0176413232 /NCGR_PEP_ID=MMETSP0127-20121128/4586_1 /TAXON_ID=938130 /ORGANISM="Platyophrya macrostoma, Strain WH" /LENGTH=215 /DNA_ID=CAMNT_0017792993 /DNA_START=186 /DNA_END=833 /DNA_ORIENTATION=-